MERFLNEGDVDASSMIVRENNRAVERRDVLSYQPERAMFARAVLEIDQLRKELERLNSIIDKP